MLLLNAIHRNLWRVDRGCVYLTWECQNPKHSQRHGLRLLWLRECVKKIQAIIFEIHVGKDCHDETHLWWRKQLITNLRTWEHFSPVSSLLPFKAEQPKYSKQVACAVSHCSPPPPQVSPAFCENWWAYDHIEATEEVKQGVLDLLPRGGQEDRVSYVLFCSSDNSIIHSTYWFYQVQRSAPLNTMAPSTSVLHGLESDL